MEGDDTVTGHARIKFIVFVIDPLSRFHVGVSFSETPGLKLVITSISNLFFLHCDNYWILKCRCYLRLYDSPFNSPAEEEDDTSKTPSQKKKMKKQRKAERAKKVYRLVLMILG